MAHSEFDAILKALERMDKLRSYLWGVCAGLFMLGVLWANNTNAISNLTRENESRKSEIIGIQTDRKATLDEYRKFREGIISDLSEIKTLLKDKR